MTAEESVLRSIDLSIHDPSIIFDEETTSYYYQERAVSFIQELANGPLQQYEVCSQSIRQLYQRSECTVSDINTEYICKNLLTRNQMEFTVVLHFCHSRMAEFLTSYMNNILNLVLTHPMNRVGHNCWCILITISNIA